MKRAIAGSIIAAATLFGAVAGQGYVAQLTQYLVSKDFPVNGRFYAYDFGKDGKIDYNDWVYEAVASAKYYRLLATTPSQDNAFGFAPVEKPADLNSTPNGYFINIDFPLDSDKRFSWVYASINGKVYKLMGATPKNTFDYLDVDGDGSADALPGVTAQIFTSQTAKFIQQNTPLAPISSAITDEQRYEIAWMWNEEKLAHDLYLNLYNLYSAEPFAQPLYNIAVQSETKHMDSVLNLAKTYDVNVSDDYMGPFDPTVVSSLQSGEFAVADIQALYDQLYAKGAQSLKDALEVGCMVEVTDVEDLDKALEVAGDNLNMVNVFTFLRDGSYNHYWAFDGALKNMGVTEGCCSLGEEYCKTVEEYPSSTGGKGKKGPKH